jgi:hypothetical protein
MRQEQWSVWQSRECLPAIKLELNRSLFRKLSMFYERSRLVRSAMSLHVLGTTGTVLVNIFVENKYHFRLRYAASLV